MATEGRDFLIQMDYSVWQPKLSVGRTSLDVIHRYPLVSSTINLARSSPEVVSSFPINTTTNNPNVKLSEQHPIDHSRQRSENNPA